MALKLQAAKISRRSEIKGEVDSSGLPGIQIYVNALSPYS